jgi:hypothetical protein
VCADAHRTSQFFGTLSITSLSFSERKGRKEGGKEGGEREREEEMKRER